MTLHKASNDFFLILRLRLNIAWVLFLIRFFTFGRGGEPSAATHLFLGDCYWRLADVYEANGDKEKALETRFGLGCFCKRADR